MVDLNQTQAAIRAGYSPHTANEQASRLLANVNIRAAYDAEVKRRAEKVELTAEYVLKTIIDTIERCKQAEPVMEFDYDQKKMVETGEYKFEHSGVLKGAELLGKHLKLFTDKIEVTDTTSRAEKISKARKRLGSE